MKISQQTLSAKLAAVTKAVSSRATLPVLEHVIFDAEAKRVYCTDLEWWILAELPELDFSACVPARLLSDLVGTTNGMIEIELRDSSIIVSANRQNSEIKTLPFGEAPMLANEPETWALVGDGFLSDVGRVALCAARDESRPVLAGVFVTPDFLLSAADGFRLATTGTGEQGVIVPAKTIQELPKLFKDVENIEYAFTETQAAFRGDGLMVVSQLIEGKYPRVEQIVPGRHKAKLTFNAGEALFALKPIMVLAERDAPLVTISREGDKIHLHSICDSGEAESDFYAAGGEFEPFAVNGQFLRDALGALGNVEMLLSGPSKPILLQENNYRHVIMPMALRK